MTRSGRWISPASIVTLLLLTLGVAAQPAAAEAPVDLDADRRAALAALPVIGGEDFEAGDLDGKVVVLTFFAAWCPPCHAEFDYLNAIDAAYGEDVVILAVNIFEDHFKKDQEARLAGFLAKKAPGFRILGEGERVGPLFNEVSRIPTLYVFGRDGQAVKHFIHARGAKKTHASFEDIDTAVRAAL